ncbi:enoyl-CoA hydratase/isomerase family protein [Pollutimonas bauzanensis]|uniref:enoyl-CoA hydratase/isomerase family protein n=1 Tax=Pollutimonas bauzanensis TaxID=658167 RepID=UPI003342892C
MTDQLLAITYNGSVAHVQINREGKRNSFNVALIEALNDAALALRKRRDIQVIILSGTGKCFSAGADLADPLQFDASTTLADKRHYALLGAEMARAWEQLPQVTVAAIERYAIGGGLGLALACDFRVAGASAFLWVPEVEIGANYGWNTVPRLISLVGPARTRRMVLLAERIAAAQAQEWGLIDELVADGETIAKARELAATLAKMPSMALAVSKRAINVVAGALTDISSHGDMEQVLLCFSDWSREKSET